MFGSIRAGRLGCSVVLCVLLTDFGSPCTASAKPLREAQLEDLERAKASYVMISKAFTPRSRGLAVAMVGHLKRRAGRLSHAQFMLAMMKIVALANNGHDAVDFGDDGWKPTTRMPFRMLWFPDALIVARAAPEASDLLGAEVVRIEGLTPPQLLARLRLLSGGTDAYRKWNLGWVIESGPMLYALGVAKDSDSLLMDFRLRTGQRVERRVHFIESTAAAIGAGPVGNWSPTPSEDERKKLWTVAAHADTSLYLAESDRLFRTAELSDLTALYVQLRANYDEDGQKIAPFVASVEKRLQQAPPQNLVFDLRFDIGGDIDQTRDLIHEFARLVQGRIYVLVGRYTFSAGIASAAAMKHDAPSRVSVVGEELGDQLRWWSEIDITCLPNSHLCLRGTHGLWDLQKGCAGEAHCYGDQYQATVGSLEPDIQAPLTAAAWLAGRDPGLEAVRSDVESHSH